MRNMPMVNMGKEERLVFVRISLVVEDINLLRQGLTRFATLPYKVSHSWIDMCLSEIGRPKYLNEKLPSLQLRRLATRVVRGSTIPMAITSLLRKLILRPETISKARRMSLIEV